MSYKIAVIYTTFLRPDLVKITLPSIRTDFDWCIIVGDQGRVGYEGNGHITKEASIPNVFNAQLPFDYGLSAARNKLVKFAAQRLKCDFCLITADSIKFIPETYEKMDLAVKYLCSEPTVGILGFDIKGRVPWEYNIDLKDRKFILTKPEPPQIDALTGLQIKKCEICRNFFLAKTHMLLESPWDGELKLCEHEDFFWRFKQAGHEVRWTPDISAEYVNSKPLEYLKYRDRMYDEFRTKLQKKYNLIGWIEHR